MRALFSFLAPGGFITSPVRHPSAPDEKPPLLPGDDPTHQQQPKATERGDHGGDVQNRGRRPQSHHASWGLMVFCVFRITFHEIPIRLPSMRLMVFLGTMVFLPTMRLPS